MLFFCCQSGFPSSVIVKLKSIVRVYILFYLIAWNGGMKKIYSWVL